MTEARVRFVVRGLDATRTDVAFTMRFTPKYGPLGLVMAKTVMGAQLRKAMDGLLKGLEDDLRTGIAVDSKGVLVAA